MVAADPTAEVTDLLQRLIRNECVNDGTPESGHESRSADLLEDYLHAPGVTLRRFAALPGRESLVVRLEGSDPKAPSLLLMGHTDVVPVNPDGWTHDPFAAELADGIVWGRGAVDMLTFTASMAVALKRLLAVGFRPRGTLVYAAVADEEAAGVYGAEWLVAHEPDAIKSDYVITEMGGARLPFGRGGPRLPIMVAEKGGAGLLLRVKGSPAHASMPYGTDNAVVKAAEIVHRLAIFRPPARIHEVWRLFVEGAGLSWPARRALTSARVLERVLPTLPVGIARFIHGCTHTTIAPTVLHGGVKINVIADTAEIQVDIRKLPGESQDDVHRMLAHAIGDLWRECEIVREIDRAATVSPTNTPLYEVIAQVSAKLVPDARLVPYIFPAATDARFLRPEGVVGYGFGLMSERIPFDKLFSMFHGNDEHVDQESLRLSTELWVQIARGFLA